MLVVLALVALCSDEYARSTSLSLLALVVLLIEKD